MLATTAAVALVALAAVMLAGAGGPAGATPSDAAALSAALPADAAATDEAAPAGTDLDAAGPAVADPSSAGSAATDALAPSTTTPAASGGKQLARKGATPAGAGAPVRPAVRLATKTTSPTPTAVDGTPCTSTAKACVDVAGRQAWLIDKGVVTRGPVQVMTGDQDDPTPIGTFHVQWKAEQYTSRQYLTQMPYSVFFADGGVAFHEGPQNTYSAGCVKLVHDDAVAWFNYLQVGDEVQVH